MAKSNDLLNQSRKKEKLKTKVVPPVTVLIFCIFYLAVLRIRTLFIRFPEIKIFNDARANFTLIKNLFQLAYRI